jgi:hypothetical protein
MAEIHNRERWNYPVEWDINQERMFVENLLAQRFNFFLVTFSLVLGGAASANSQLKLQLLLLCGLILCLLMWATVYRIYVKVDVTLKMCYEHEDKFLYEIAKRTKQQGIIAFVGVNSLVGVWIPLSCVLIIVVALVLSLSGTLKAG